MKFKLIKNILFLLAIFLGIFFWAKWEISAHSSNAIVSWDEGFHGGAALYISQVIKHPNSSDVYAYIRDDFLNGIIWYPPLWLGLAGSLGVLLGPSVETFRLATLIFGILGIILVNFFAKTEGGSKSGLIAGVSLATVPIFMVYSHLMMIEVPLLFGVSLALIFYYRYLTKLKLNPFDIGFTAVAFVIGVLAKIIGIVIIFGTVIGFGFLLRLFFNKSKFWKRFYSRWTAYFLILGFLAFTLYRVFILKILNADMVLFHVDQSRELGGLNSSILIGLLETFSKSLFFYSSDFINMPVMSLLWFGSFFGYILIKRNILGLYLLVWAIITYLAFSSVRPQSVQYILPIFAPLTLGLGMFWGSLFSLKNKFVSLLFLSVVLIGIIWLGFSNLNKTQTFFWRNLVTNQSAAALFLAGGASTGDRIIVSGDGNRLLIELMVMKLNKRIQTINGAAINCGQSLTDSTEWMFSDYGPQNPTRMNFSSENWDKRMSFESSQEPIRIYKNRGRNSQIILDDQDKFLNVCPRIFLPGQNEIIIKAIPKVQHQNCPINSDLIISLRDNRGIHKQIKFNQQELNDQDGKEQIYRMIFDQPRLDNYLYLSINVPANIQFEIKSERITNLSRQD